MGTRYCKYRGNTDLRCGRKAANENLSLQTHPLTCVTAEYQRRFGLKQIQAVVTVAARTRSNRNFDVTKPLVARLSKRAIILSWPLHTQLEPPFSRNSDDGSSVSPIACSERP